METKTHLKTISRFKVVAEPSTSYQEKLTNSTASSKYIRENFFKDDIEVYESFFMLLLNRANKVVGYVKISQGGITGTVVDVKLMAKIIVDNLASGIIVCHNHPSGNTDPSAQDKAITKKIQGMCEFFDCNLLDHIILTADSYLSFADEGYL
jgi:DNA repair protein RadC